ncbi:MAG: hypothetical protein EOP61_12475 [Sphingomonadales bacterium]|nr:MAG: hypothetical protein EOP61_12475 [Sphingomonadales bacterium]
MRHRLGLAFAAMALWATSAAAPPQASLPDPRLYLWQTELYTASGQDFVRYSYRVTNQDKYPAEMFLPAPDLPPCGRNANSSRTWVDFFDGEGKRLYGFCALAKPEDLNKIWFAVPHGTRPPSGVYIEIFDRRTNLKFRSNLAPTQL